MPKVTVTVEHDQPIEAVVEKVTPAIEKTVKDFQGHDLSLDWQTDHADFKFKKPGIHHQGRRRGRGVEHHRES